MSDTLIRLSSLSPGAGCACKLGPSALAEVMSTLAPPTSPDLLVGSETGDDAMVWRRPDGSALVATTDFFTPIVDDPYTWGRIAGANAASDVFAMGARPLFALNLVAWPSDLPSEMLTEVMRGGADIAAAGGWVVGGGHTIDVSEPLYGQAVIGEVDPDRVLTNAGGLPGQRLVLTKPVGTGLVSTAVKRSSPEAVESGTLAGPYQAAVESMTRLNGDAAGAALEAGATVCTDVTGFGLLGHLHKLAMGSGVAAIIDADAVPLLPGVEELVADGQIPGGTGRNLEFVGTCLLSDGIDDSVLQLLGDPQTSGGLLFGCRPDEAERAVSKLRASGHAAAIIGELVDGPAGQVRVTSSAP